MTGAKRPAPHTTIPDNAASPGLSDRLAAGFAIVLAQTLASKLLRIASQIALAWFLLPKDFGVAAIALAAYGIASMLCAAPIYRKLVQLGKAYREYITEAVWFSFLIGVFMTAALAVLAKPLADFYGEAQLAPLTWMLASALPFFSLGGAARTALTIDLRFGVSSLISLFALALQSVLAVVLAWDGFGPYALVIPILVVDILSLPALWSAACVMQHFHWHPDGTRFKRICLDALWIWGAVLPAHLIDRGVYFVGGHYLGPSGLGLYYFSYALVMQLIVLLGRNIANVLTPGFALTAGQGAEGIPRLVRAMRLTTALAGAACFGIAALARPLIETIFPAKWMGAIPVVQVLAIGLAGMPASSVLQAYLFGEGWYRRLAAVNWIRLGLLIPFVFLLAPRGVLWFSIAICIPYVVDPMLLALVVAYGHRKYLGRLLLAGMVRPLVIGALPALVVVALEAWLERVGSPRGIRLGIGAITLMGLWVVVVRFLLPEMWREMVGRLITLHKRIAAIARPKS